MFSLKLKAINENNNNNNVTNNTTTINKTIDSKTTTKTITRTSPQIIKIFIIFLFTFHNLTIK